MPKLMDIIKKNCPERRLETIALIRELLNDVISSHADPESCDYNECEKPGEMCLWCSDANKVLKEIDQD